eukprot:Gb_22774 [translate_table: standard]
MPHCCHYVCASYRCLALPIGTQGQPTVIRDISLPNSNTQLVNGYFADASFLTIQLEEQVVKQTAGVIDAFCPASEAKIRKTFYLAFFVTNLDDCLSQYAQSRVQIGRFSGIPFTLQASLIDVGFCFVKIEEVKLLADQNHDSSHQEKVRKALQVKWEMCCRNKEDEGLGLIDICRQGIPLCAKWLVRAAKGDESWKLFIRHNVSNGSLGLSFLNALMVACLIKFKRPPTDAQTLDPNLALNMGKGFVAEGAVPTGTLLPRQRSRKKDSPPRKVMLVVRMDVPQTVPLQLIGHVW